MMSDGGIVYSERLASLEARQVAIERSIEKVTDAIIQLKEVSIRQTSLNEEIVRVNKHFDEYRMRMEERMDGIEDDIKTSSESIASHNTIIKIGGGLVGILQMVIVELYGGYLANIDLMKQQQTDVDKRVAIIERVVMEKR